MKSKWFFVAALAAAWAIPASAEPVQAQNPKSVLKALQDAGYPGVLATDKVGDPLINTGVSGTSIQIFFYNCTDHKDCATVQFNSGYDLAQPVSLERINQWNSSQRFGRAYLDKENDPILQMDVDLDDGGMSPLLFIDNIEFFSSILTNFEKHIGYRQ